MSGNAEAAAEAYKRFVNKNYHGCLDMLHTLASSTARGDPKIQHNVAVCEYFQGGYANVENFLRDLDKLGKPGAGQGHFKSAHFKSAQALQQLAEARAQEYRPMCLEFDGHEYVRYNEAVALFHQRQYRDALGRLAPLYHNGSSLQELLNVRVVLLMFACVLAQYPTKSVLQPREQVKLRDRARELADRTEQCRPFMQQHDQREDEARRAGGEHRPQLKLSQHALLLRAHYKAAEGDHAAGLELLHEFMRNSTEAEGEQVDWWAQVLYLNNLGVLHLNIGKPHLAALYLSKAVSVFEQYRVKSSGSDPQASSLTTHPSVAAVMYNSAMCSMVRGQYELAFRSLIVACPQLHDMPALWLRLAQCCMRQWELNLERWQAQEHKELTRQPSGHAAQRRVIHLPTQATLRPEAAPPHGQAPCVTKTDAGDEMSLAFADKCLRNAHYLLLRRHRGLRRPQPRNSAGKEREGVSPARDDKPAAEGASDIGQLREEEEEAAAATEGEDADSPPGQLEETEVGEAVCREQHSAAMLQAVYCNMAYVALCLNNPAVALTAAKKLLGLPEWSIFREYRVVCLSYSVEALCALNRSSEALSMLSSTDLQYLLQGEPSALKLPAAGMQPPKMTCASELPGVGESPLYMGTPSERDRAMLSRKHAAALFTNLCVVHIMSGKYSRAQQCLDQCKAEGQPIAHLLQIYLHLAQGMKSEAVALATRQPPQPPYS